MEKARSVRSLSEFGCSHISSVADVSPFAPDFVNGPELTMVPWRPKSRPFLSCSQADLIHWGMEGPKSSHPDAAQDEDTKEGEDIQFKRAFPCFRHGGFRYRGVDRVLAGSSRAKFNPSQCRRSKVKTR